MDDLAIAAQWRLGLVVPKRHARRSVTRQLIKRQARAAWQRHAGLLASGWWVLRLRAPIDKARFVSAASPALRQELAHELDGVWQRAADAQGRPSSQRVPRLPRR